MSWGFIFKMKRSKQLIKKGYNCENKNRLRELIIDEIRKRKIKSILTLESPEFLFSKALPDKKIIVWENDPATFKKMEKKVPRNVDLIFGNVGKFGVIGKNVDMIYLDFTGLFSNNQDEVVRLKHRLQECKLFVITICLREYQGIKKVYSGDYQFDLINKIQSLTELDWKIVYGESYYDSVQMVTIILENIRREE